MTREKYNDIRTKCIRIFGVAMLALGIFTAVFGGLHTKMVHDRSTAVIVGTVVGEKYVTDDSGKKIRKAEISYTLPDGHWLVLYPSDLALGAEVHVYYNPDHTEEKYIEGFEESPLYYVRIGLYGVGMGIAAIAVSVIVKKRPEINDAIDLADRQIR